MTFLGFKCSDKEINEWLDTKENKSLTIKEALKEKLQRELQTNYESQNLKVIITDA